MKVSPRSLRWKIVKDAVQERAKEIKPKIIADLLVLSTMEASENEQDSKKDLFSAVEVPLTSKMKVMALDDLINLLWTALKIERGSTIFFTKLEEEISKRIRGIKDDQFETMLQCFLGERSEQSLAHFSDRFMDLVFRIIMEKRDRF